MDSPYVYRIKTGWLYTGIAVLTVAASALALRLILVGFDFVAFVWAFNTATWWWLYGTRWAYEVRVDATSITFRRLVTQRSHPLSELRAVEEEGLAVWFRFQRHCQPVYAGADARALIDHVEQVKPSLRDPRGPGDFDVVLRGYSRIAVEDYIARQANLESEPSVRREPPPFPRAMRGYKRSQVDAYLASRLEPRSTTG